MITAQFAQKILHVVDAGLSMGLGEQIPGKMCVEAAVCYAMGLPHNDRPPCVANSVRMLKIVLNDSRWASNTARAKGMRRLAIAQLGTRETLDELEFVRRVSLMTVQKILPIAYRSLASKLFSFSRERSLNLTAQSLEQVKTLKESRHIFRNAINNDYFDEVSEYTIYAINCISFAEEDKYHSAIYIIDVGIHIALAVRFAARYNEELLGLFAEEVVKILQEMKTPGSEFLYLTES